MRTVMNPPNPFESRHRDLLEPAPHVKLQIFEDATRDILSRNESPDLPFRWSLNPYRGCFHACAYCYARPTHEYWGFGAGTDFESKIIVKREAATLLRRTFEKPSWKGELILFSGNTDCYQPLEASLELTRACLEVCAEYRNPVGIITKGVLVLRDLELLRRLHQEASVRVYFSIPFSDDEVARKVEPHAPSSRKRFEAMATLANAGIPTGISLSPIIPGLNDEDMPDLLARAKQAGAVRGDGDATASVWPCRAGVHGANGSGISRSNRQDHESDSGRAWWSDQQGGLLRTSPWGRPLLGDDRTVIRSLQTQGRIVSAA